MKVDQLASDDCVYKDAYLALKKIIKECEKKYDTKIYIDSHVGFAANWMDSKVYLHGDRNVVNIVCLKLVVWQHNRGTKRGGGCLYAYPVEELK